MAEGEDHRERRLADSSKLQSLIADLSKVPPSSRMFYVHDELMHAIDRCLATHKGHRFEQREIDVIKDVAFQIIYTLDPSNRPARGFFAIWREFKALSALQKLGAIGTVLAFIGGTIGGSITLWEKVIRPSVAVGAAPPQPAQATSPASKPASASPPTSQPAQAPPPPVLAPTR